MALTPGGLIVKRYPEVLEDLETLEQINISPEFVTTDDTAVGQFNQIIAETVADILFLVEAVNDNFNVDKAEGTNLDDLGALKGVYRLQETVTEGVVYLTGVDGTVVPSNSLFEDSQGNRFFTTQNYVIGKTSAVTVIITINMLLNSAMYTISVNGTDYSFTSDSSATVSEILNGLKAQIDADSGAVVTATINSNELTIQATSDIAFNLSNTTNLLVNDVTSKAYVYAQEVGEIVVPADTLTNIITPVLGFESVTNPDVLITGRERETDEDYRVRIKADSAVNGKATVPAITANLRNTPGVSYAVVVENDTMVTDGEGRPPKSFEAIIQGGTDTAIANTIWDTKPAGIESYGTTTVAIEDSDGQSQEVSFSRPDPVHIAVRVQYTLYDEESFPTNGEQFIQTAVLEYINGLGIGVDVIPKRLYGPIYSATSGIEDLTVEVQEITNPGDTPVALDWQETSIPISARDFSQTTVADIYVAEV